MLRICMVLHHCEEPFGGPELQALRLAERFVADGHAVVIIAKGSGRHQNFEIIAGVPVYRLNYPGLASIEVLLRLFLLRSSFDIIHVHGTGRLATACIFFAQHFHKKVFVKVVANIGKLSKFSSVKIKKLMAANAMIAITHDIEKDLRVLGFDEDKIVYIPNGVDNNIFHPPSLEEKRALRKKINLPLNKMIFCFTGKITKRKGIDVLLEAWKEADTKKTAALIVLGNGTGQKDSLEEYSADFINKYNLADSVKFIGAVDNVAEYLKASDVFVFPSRWEGLPNSLMEAMAVGLLCIASDIEGVKELITSGETGILTPVEDSVALGHVLNEVYYDYSTELGTRGAYFIHQNFSIEKTKTKLEELFSKVN